MADETIRVALLCRSQSIPDWMADALTEMIEETTAQMEMTVIASPSEGLDTDSETKHEGLFNGIRHRFRDLTNRNPMERMALDEVPAVADIPVTNCEYHPSRDGLGVTLPKDVVARVGSRCDVAIHVDIGILKGEILHAPEYGVLSFHHGDFREYRGLPAGFWEFVNDEPYVGITVQRLTEELDAGYVITFERVDISDLPTWKSVRNRLYERSEPLLSRAIDAISDPSFQPEKIPADELGELYTSDDFNRSIRIRSRLKEAINLLRLALD